MNTKDLGSTTAYASAVEGGYTGTREEWYNMLLLILSGSVEVPYDTMANRPMINGRVVTGDMSLEELGFYDNGGSCIRVRVNAEITEEVVVRINGKEFAGELNSDIWVDELGDAVIECSGASVDLDIPHFGLYYVDLEYATIHVTTTSDILAYYTDRPITLKKSSKEIATGKMKYDGDSAGTYSVDFTVLQTGSYRIETEAGGITSSTSVNVSSLGTTYNASMTISCVRINIWTYERSFWGQKVLFGTEERYFDEDRTDSIAVTPWFVNSAVQRNVSSVDVNGNTATGTATLVLGKSENVKLNLYRISVTTEESDIVSITLTNGNNTRTSTFTNGTAELVFGEEFLGECSYTFTNGTKSRTKSITITKGTFDYTIEVSFAIKIVSWADGTDREIVDMLDAHYNGELNIHDYWNVGDERVVSLSAMASTGVGETQPARDVTLVIVNSGGKQLNDPVNGISECAFVVQQKNALPNSGYVNSTDISTGGWDACQRRTWCNNTYRMAFPSSLRSIFRQHKNMTSSGNKSTSLTESVDYFALASESEICGTNVYSALGEGLQWDYYKDSEKRIKYYSDTSSNACYWKTRSPSTANAQGFCEITAAGGVTGFFGASRTGCIVPFGCI